MVDANQDDQVPRGLRLDYPFKSRWCDVSARLLPLTESLAVGTNTAAIWSEAAAHCDVHRLSGHDCRRSLHLSLRKSRGFFAEHANRFGGAACVSSGEHADPRGHHMLNFGCEPHVLEPR
jgi:hypothetical protein